MDYLEQAHGASSFHRHKIRASAMCGCFYCKTKFPPKKITEWIDSERHPVGLTALCPICGIDAVIGDASGFPLTDQFLTDMHERWFGMTSKLSMQ